MQINVRNKKGEIIKACEAKKTDLSFGMIRALVELLQIEDTTDTNQILRAVLNAWDSLIIILSEAFPDMESDDWNNVPLKEVVPVVIDILKYSFSELLQIPTKN